LDDLRRALASSIRALEDSPAEPVESEPDVAEPDLDWLASASPMDPAPTARLARLLAAAAAAGFAAWVVGSELQGPPLAALAAAAAGAALLGALPRLGWVILALACCASLAIEGSIGAAALVALGAVVPVLVMPTEPLRWPLAILAPALGVIGLAAAWPALAARAQSVWQRAALGAVGWIWLELASVLAGTALYTDLQDIVPGPAAWSASAGSAMHDALRPLISSGALVPALVWALAAVALPLVVRQQDLILRAGAVALWAALVLGATVAVLSMSAGHPGIGVRNALLGVLGGMAAALLVPGPFKARRGADARPRLA
jgi:hypothetical protein